MKIGVMVKGVRSKIVLAVRLAIIATENPVSGQPFASTKKGAK
jgi:hypothetical protein